MGTALIKSSMSPPVEMVRKWLPWEQATGGVPQLCVRGGGGLEGMTLFSFESATEHLPFLFFMSAQNGDSALPLMIVTLWVGVSSQSFGKDSIDSVYIGILWFHSLTAEKKQTKVVESVSWNVRTSLTATYYLQGNLLEIFCASQSCLSRGASRMEMSRIGWKWLCLV